MCFGRQVIRQDAPQNKQGSCFWFENSFRYSKRAHGSHHGEIHLEKDFTVRNKEEFRLGSSSFAQSKTPLFSFLLATASLRFKKV